MKPMKYIIGNVILAGLAAIIIGFSTCKTDVKAEDFNEESNPRVEYNSPKPAIKDLGKLVNTIAAIQKNGEKRDPEKEARYKLFLDKSREDYEKLHPQVEQVTLSRDTPKTAEIFYSPSGQARIRALGEALNAGLLCDEGYCAVVIKIHPENFLLTEKIVKVDPNNIYSKGNGSGCLGRIKPLPPGAKSAFISYRQLEDGSYHPFVTGGYITKDNEVQVEHDDITLKYSFFDKSACEEGEK